MKRIKDIFISSKKDFNKQKQNYLDAVEHVLVDRKKDLNITIDTFVEDSKNQIMFAKYVEFDVLDLNQKEFDLKYSVITRGIEKETQQYMIYKNIYLIEENENPSNRILLIQNFSDIDISKLLSVKFMNIALVTRNTLNVIMRGQNKINKSIDDKEGSIEFLREVLKQAGARNASDVKISLKKNILYFKLTIGSKDYVVEEFGLKEAFSVRNTLEYIAKQENGERSYDSTITIDGIEYRINFWESAFGWRATIRVFDGEFHTEKMPTLKDLGYEDEEIDLIEDIIKFDSGLILFTASTGQGKTTSLNALGDELGRRGLDVLTVEDPVEQFSANCEQVDTTIYSTASENLKVTKRKMLKHFLRSKPNVIIFGEIRDLEDMELAYDASVTGHLVLATLHSESILTAFKRLLSTGVDVEDLKMILRGVVYQKLWKQLCDNCKIKDTHFYKPNQKGCSECKCGYKSRKTPVNEIAMFSTMKEWDIKQVNSFEDYISLHDSAKRKLNKGIIDKLHYDAIISRQREPEIDCKKLEV